jgi:hypothetical protein
MRERILDYLTFEVKKYIIPDIERLEKLRPQGHEGLAACAIPTALFLFVIVDFFGYLVRIDSKKPKLDDTEGNLRAIFAHPLSKFSSEYTKRLKMLVGLFRNGLMHQIFPKAAGIRKAPNIDHLFDRFKGLDHLNVDRFSADVLTMIRSLCKSLPAPEWTDLREQMSERLDRTTQSDFREMKLKRKAEQSAHRIANKPGSR